MKCIRERRQYRYVVIIGARERAFDPLTFLPVYSRAIFSTLCFLFFFFFQISIFCDVSRLTLSRLPRLLLTTRETQLQIVAGTNKKGTTGLFDDRFFGASRGTGTVDRVAGDWPQRVGR